MVFHRPDADAEKVRDFPVEFALRDQLEHLPLAQGQHFSERLMATVRSFGGHEFGNVFTEQLGDVTASVSNRLYRRDQLHVRVLLEKIPVGSGGHCRLQIFMLGSEKNALQVRPNSFGFRNDIDPSEVRQNHLENDHVRVQAP